MYKKFKILFYLLAYFILCGKSCVDERSHIAWEEKQAEMARDSIRFDFEAENLSENARFAADIIASQKLKDISDYLKFFTDVSMDSLFREKAGEMISKEFISKENQLSFGPVKNNEMKAITLEEFMEKAFGKDILRSEVIFDSVSLLEPLQKTGEEIYSGKLSAYQTVFLYLATDSIISPTIPITIEFISSKRNKIIGEDTLNVWEVSLGAMEF
jgi:hypothetical protein